MSKRSKRKYKGLASGTKKPLTDGTGTTSYSYDSNGIDLLTVTQADGSGQF